MKAPTPAPLFRVQLDAHHVERWTIPAACVKVPAANADHARWIVVAQAHRAAGAPPWKPLIRESLAHARAS